MPTEFTNTYISTQLASFTALPFWYPFFARSKFTEFEFVHKNFRERYRNYFLNFNKKLFIDGVKSSYKGIDVCAVAILGYPLLNLSQQKLATLINDKPTLKDQLLAAGLVGAVSPIVYNPLNVSLVTLMKYRMPNMFVSTNFVLQNFGFFSLYKGSTFFAIRNATFMPCFFIMPNFIYDKHVFENESVNRMFSYILSSMCALTVVMPKDVCATMSASDLENKTYKNNLHIIKTALKIRGVRGLFAGYAFRLPAAVLEISIFHTANAWYKNLLN